MHFGTEEIIKKQLGVISIFSKMTFDSRMTNKKSIIKKNGNYSYILNHYFRIAPKKF